jgi:flagellar hook assembly protein FlgD
LPITDKLPTSFALGLKGSNISPGLFNISYAIPERSLVEISVYSVNGRKIATLVKGTKDTGYYTVRWDGRSDTGSRVGSGIYIIKMETPKKIFTEKLIITR